MKNTTKEKNTTNATENKNRVTNATKTAAVMKAANAKTADGIAAAVDVKHLTDEEKEARRKEAHDAYNKNATAVLKGRRDRNAKEYVDATSTMAKASTHSVYATVLDPTAHNEKHHAKQDGIYTDNNGQDENIRKQKNAINKGVEMLQKESDAFGRANKLAFNDYGDLYTETDAEANDGAWRKLKEDVMPESMDEFQSGYLAFIEKEEQARRRGMKAIDVDATFTERKLAKKVRTRGNHQAFFEDVETTMQKDVYEAIRASFESRKNTHAEIANRSLYVERNATDDAAENDADAAAEYSDGNAEASTYYVRYDAKDFGVMASELDGVSSQCISVSPYDADVYEYLMTALNLTPRDMAVLRYAADYLGYEGIAREMTRDNVREKLIATHQDFNEDDLNHMADFSQDMLNMLGIKRVTKNAVRRTFDRIRDKVAKTLGKMEIDADAETLESNRATLSREIAAAAAAFYDIPENWRTTADALKLSMRETALDDINNRLALVRFADKATAILDAAADIDDAAADDADDADDETAAAGSVAEVETTAAAETVAEATHTYAVNYCKTAKENAKVYTITLDAATSHDALLKSGVTDRYKVHAVRIA